MRPPRRPAARPARFSGWRTAGSSAAGTLAKATGGASALGGLATVASAFEKLGLKPEMAMKAVPVLANYVTKSGGAEVGSLLLGALK